ncbi:copine i-like protein [Leptomonas pyrrhocoris]|uniref:Copine i-like protein n=1 Tax=Leptomonas pyrrhocoris TaxID=157538 RepID=A0A0N0DZK0_LEPPY|nr:copine i-like protein [Leptomonas pyrrhocoris]XP_015663828.1 copine i-like protein [Leptomonas pyrrhocoris]KPA85388.1 copine i-like protein [Leptomonas pyrrhocoris]KPA85389.1 copine i-like protein [Leptomonas pyrrhocoris]|eukprot:XP_015663827.1 copine i-like protein [Leptomonas pyrrhocoris]
MTSTNTVVQVYVKCNKLKDTDVTSKSDPYAVLYDTTNGGRIRVGQTEVLKNNLNPQFQTCIPVDYFFEIRQTMRVEVWDKDVHSKDDPLGNADFTMGQLMSSRGSTVTLTLGGKSTVTLTASYVGTQRGTVALTFRGRDLKKMDLFSKSDPYFILSRQLPGGQRAQVYKSEVIDKTLNPQWKTTPPLDLAKLCGGDMASLSIVFECFDKDTFNDDMMGSFAVSGEQLLVAGGKEFELTLNKKGKTKSYGFIAIDRCDYVKGYSFPEYLQGGLQLNIAFSIDFTGSNGPPNDPRSLHFYNPQRPNNYIRAMLAVSDVVQEYDSDRMFPAYGFGAIAPFTNGTSHFFPLSGNPANAYLSGMQAVVDTYASLLPVLRFSGPTNFAPTIRTITDGARQARGVYTILLILTDGAITDMQDTIDAIVEADDAPLSIVIIGIGRADFSSMEQLDSDGGMLSDRRGRVARRDLVQFVHFNQFEGKDPSMLAAAVLKEVPLQVEMWGRICGVSPSH